MSINPRNKRRTDFLYMRNMKISVIVPTYKPQAYLWECLDSIYNQTFPKLDYELILVLNGCNEPYNTQIKEWLARHGDMQVQYVQTDVGGVSNARNIALDRAKGEYIAFIDDDDMVSPCYLEELYGCASPDVVSLCYPYAFNDGDMSVQLPYGITDAYEYCTRRGCNKILSKVRKYFSGPCMKLIGMSFIQDRRFDVRFKNGEDSLFMFLISDKINKVAFTSRKAIYYRRVRTNSAVTTIKSFKDVSINSFNLIKEYTKKYISQIKRYKFCFYITRILGSVKTIIKYKKNTF